MNPQQLSALFAQHRTAVLGAAGAGVVGLALLSKKRKATVTTAAGAPVSAGALVPGTIPAAAVAPTASGYDSTATDVANWLSPQLDALRQTQGTPAAHAPTPVASSLFAPTGSGKYVQNQNGTIGEVESDGSVYAMQLGEWLPYYNNGARPAATVGNDLAMFSVGDNLAKAQKAATSAAG